MLSKEQTDLKDEEEIDLGALLASMTIRVLRHKRIAISVFILVSAIALTYALLATPFYQSTTKIIYQSSKNAGSNLSALAALAGVSTNASDDPSAYLPDIVYSKKIMSAVLDHKWIYNGDSILLEDFWETKTDTTAENWELKKRYALLDRLSNQKSTYVSFAQDKKTFVITLTTEFEDPQIAYDVNLFLYQELNNILVNKMNFKASENRKFIEERLAEVKQSLSSAENNLKRFRQNNILRIDPADRLEEERLQREVLINQEIMIQLQKQYEMAKIEEVRDLPVLDVIDPPMLPLEKSKPKRKLIVLAGGVAAFFFAIIFAIGIDLWQEKRKDIIKFYNDSKKEHK